MRCQMTEDSVSPVCGGGGAAIRQPPPHLHHNPRISVKVRNRPKFSQNRQTRSGQNRLKVGQKSEKSAKSAQRGSFRSTVKEWRVYTYLTPRDYLARTKHFKEIFSYFSRHTLIFLKTFAGTAIVKAILCVSVCNSLASLSAVVVAFLVFASAHADAANCFLKKSGVFIMQG